MPNETVTVSISGANPQSKTVTVAVDSNTGGGTATFNWTGSAFGLDNIAGTATITGQNLSSNTAQHRWGQNDTGVSTSNGSGFNSNTFFGFTVIGVFPDGTHTGSSQTTVTGNTHFFLNWNPIPGVSFYNIYCIQSVPGSAGAPTATLGKLHGTGTGNGGNNSTTAGGGGPNYPPSVTQLWMDDGGFFPYKGDGTAAPSTNTSLAAPVPGPASGHLTITPTGTASVVGGVQTLTVTVSGIVYSSIPYIPAYESVTGNLPLYNNPSSNVFTYPTFNGNPVDKPTAATNAWALSGNNASYQGRMAINFDGTNFVLNYNGAAPDVHVDTTTLTITADDIAWFYATNKSYDIFNNSGGINLSVLVNWLVKPAIASVSPTAASADGNAHVFNVALVKPISPRQLGTQFSTGNSFSAAFSMVGGTVTNTTAIFDGSGWLLGWNVTATIPSSTSNGTATLSANISAPTLTYLNGAGFTTGAVQYINGVIATINLTGSAFTAPQAYSFSISPAGPSYAAGIALTLTGVTFQQQNNPITLTFIGVNQATNGSFVFGTGSQQSRVPGTFNGQSGFLTTFQLLSSSNLLPTSPGAIIGFNAVDSTSGLTVQYLTSTAYLRLAVIGGGGGGAGGGGCFSANVGIRTPSGIVEFGSLPRDRAFLIENETGVHLASLVVHENYEDDMIYFASGKFVTANHHMKRGDEWIPAEQYFSENLKREHMTGTTVYNLHVHSPEDADHHYILETGDVAHNLLQKVL